MTFFIYSGQPRDYDSLGFSVTNGQVLDGTLSDPVVTSPPDANWSVTGSGPETVTRHGQNPGGTPSPPEPTDGFILRYSDADNAYVATDPQGFVELTPVADAIVGKINELSAPKWKASTAYMAGDTVLAPDGSLVKTKVARTSSGSYSTTPASPPVLGAPTTATTGGTIAAGTTYYYKATALSAIGETLASAEVSRVIAAALATPVLNAPTTATTGGTLAAGTYYYKITATNAIGETVGSNEVSQATTGTTSTVGLSWAAITDATGYKIYRATTAGGQSTSPALVESVGAVTSYTDTGTAVSAGAVPATNTTATSTNTVGLSWAAVTGATGYKIYRATTTGGQSTSPALLATLGAVTSYTDTGSATTAGSVPTTNTANERAFWQSVNTYAGTQAETELSASYVSAVVLTGPGIDLTGTTDSTAALQALVNAGLAFGARHFVEVPGSTYKVTMTSGSQVFNITDDGVTFDLSTSTIDNTAYTSTADTVTPIFLVDGAQDFTLKLRDYVGYTLPTPASHLGYRGATLVRAINGADGVRVDARASHLRYGVQSGDYADGTKGLCRNFDIKLRTSFCGYPVALYLADNVTLDVDADDVHRGAYIAGCNDVRGVVRWKNQYIADIVCLVTDALVSGTDTAAQADPVGAPTTSRGCTNVSLTSIDKGSTTTTTSTVCAGITLSRVDAVAFRNIKLNVYSKATDTVSRYVGGVQILSGAKAIWNRYAKNWTTNVVLDNIEISGTMDQSAMTLSGNVAAGGFYILTYDGGASDAATARNIKVSNFVHLPSAGNTRANYIQVPGGLGTVLDNCHASGTDLQLWVASTGDVTMRDSKAKAVTANGSPLALVNSAISGLDTATTARCTNATIFGATGITGFFKHTQPTLSGATSTWASAIPQGAVVKSVLSRVTTAITGATGYSIGVSGDTTRYGNFLAAAAGTTSNNRSWSATEAANQRTYQSATDLLISKNGGSGAGTDFSGGVVRLALVYDLAANMTS